MNLVYLTYKLLKICRTSVQDIDFIYSVAGTKILNIRCRLVVE